MKAMTIFHKASFQLKKHSPEILVIGGILGVVTAAVMACNASLKAAGICYKLKEEEDKIQAIIDDTEIKEDYSEEDAKKDLSIIRGKAGVKIISAYVPAVIVGVVSIGLILSSNDILKKRNAALGSAYAILDKGFKAYQKRVAEKFGDEAERDIRFNTKTKTVTETTVDEDGVVTETEKEIKIFDVNGGSSYARYFDSESKCWEEGTAYNLFNLRTYENWANDLLKFRGHLFLNEVYDMLGLKRSAAGQIVGWRYDTKNPTGDNYVSFDIREVNREIDPCDATDDYGRLNGYERTILLDFNVDGDILSLGVV